MLRNIRILQIGDLLIDGPESAASIVNALGDAYKLLAPIHYLVVCGNITAAGQTAEFAAAKEALATIRDTLFPGHDPYVRNRVVLVPGSTDAPADEAGARSYERFGSFYNDFYQDEQGRIRPPMEAFDPNKAAVRSLVDLSLVGLCYFADVADPNTAIRNTLSALNRAQSRFGLWNYAIETATILVSSFPPLLSHDGSPRVRQRTNNPELYLGMPIALHLVGGPVTCIEPEPWHCEHITLGLGPRLPSGVWSGRINLIDIQQQEWGSGPEPKNLERRTVRVAAYKWPETFVGEKPQAPKQMFGGHELPLDEGDGFVYQPIFSDLSKLLDQGNLAIRVTGFPGKGKNKIFLQLQSQEGGNLFPSPRAVACQRMMNYNEWDQILDGLINELKPRMTEQPIMVIHDSAGRSTDTPQYERLQEIQDTIVQVTRSGKYKVIYLLDYVGRPPQLPEDFKSYELPPLSTDILSALVKRYSSRLPISNKQVQALTGGYLGLTLSLLQQVKKNFDQEPWGARPVQAETSWRLLAGALRSSDDLDRATTRFFEVIWREAGGRQLYDYIRAVLLARVKDHSFSEKLISPLTFTVEDVVQSLEASGQKSVKETVARAAEAFVTARLLTVEDSEYRVREMIPFLVRALSGSLDAAPIPPQSTARREGTVPADPAGLIFVSYRREDQQRVRKVVEGLRAEGLTVFWDEDIPGGARWPRELHAKLKASSCVLLCCTSGEFDPESYVWDEVMAYKRKVFPVLLDEGAPIPDGFDATQAGRLAGWNGRRAAAVWKRLISDLKQLMAANKEAA